jgi:hypothetical protein
MRKIASFIQAHLTLRVFLPLLAAALATTWYGLFWSVDHFSGLSGGLGFLDMQPWLTADELFTQIRSYPEEAVEFYLGWSAFDYAWPFITFTTMLFISAWLLHFVPAAWQTWFPWMVAAACMTVLMDWAENAGFSLLVMTPSQERLWLAQFTLFLHAMKLLFNLLFNLGFWLLLATSIISRIKSRLAT